MTLPVLILRPLSGAQKTAERARQLGLEPVVDPLFCVESSDWTAPPVDDFDALFLTSANALEFGGAQLATLKKIPVLAVGKATAAAAERSGFQIAEVGQGGAQSLLNSASSDQYRRILWLRAVDHTKVTSPDHEITGINVYESKPLPLGGKAQSCLDAETVVLLHSVRAAVVFSEEMKRLGLDRSQAQIAALSKSIADCAGSGWKGSHWADHPTDEALLSLASALCRGKEIEEPE